MADSPKPVFGILNGDPPNQPMHLIPLLKQQLGEIRAILPPVIPVINAWRFILVRGRLSRIQLFRTYVGSVPQ